MAATADERVPWTLDRVTFEQPGFVISFSQRNLQGSRCIFGRPTRKQRVEGGFSLLVSLEHEDHITFEPFLTGPFSKNRSKVLKSRRKQQKSIFNMSVTVASHCTNLGAFP